MLLIMMLLMMLIMMAVVEVNIMWICYSFVEIRIFDAGLGRQIRILTPSRVELIDKGSIFGLETTINR